jgi:hypothetical protein
MNFLFITRIRNLVIIYKMDVARLLSPIVYRLPTMFLDLDTDGEVVPGSIVYLDEPTGQCVLGKVAQFQFVEAFFRYPVSVMMLSIQKGVEQHCNAFVLHAGAIERFEPRGDLQGPDQSEIVRNLYHPDKLDRFMKTMFQAWCSRTGTRRQISLLYGEDDPIGTMPELRYLPPKEDGIGSCNVLYANAASCSGLVFSYLRIRTGHSLLNRPREVAHRLWLQYELSRGLAR